MFPLVYTSSDYVGLKCLIFFLFFPCRLILEILIFIIDKANCSGTENEKLIYIKVSNNSLKEPVLPGERR